MKKTIFILFFSLFIHFSWATTITVIKVDGSINPASNDFIISSIQKAHANGSNCLVIQLDTPGGLLSSTREIVQAILEAPLPVVVYVSPQGAHAGSAGVMITLSAHIAAMAPGTNIGAAHPVAGTGKDVEGEMAKKVTNDAAAFAESIAKTRGRNTKWAIDAVRKSVSITADDALQKGVVDLIAPSLDKLIEKIHGREVSIKDKKTKLDTKNASLITLEMNLKQKIIDALADPNIAYLLIGIGGLGLYFELSNPGLVVPGVIGGIALILGFVSVQALPINYGGLLLLLLGLALLIAEVFLPSFGILGIGGIISMVLGAIFFIDPTHPGDIAVSLSVVIPTIVTVGIFMLVIAYLLVKTHRRKIVTGKEGIIGEKGEVTSDILPPKEGKVFVDGEYWTATSTEPLYKGDHVVVVSVEGSHFLIVKKL